MRFYPFVSSKSLRRQKVPLGGSTANKRSDKEIGYEELKWDRVRDGW